MSCSPVRRPIGASAPPRARILRGFGAGAALSLILAVLAPAAMALPPDTPRVEQVPSTGPATGRPYTVDDMLKLESFGNASVDPTGRWAVFEQRASYETATAFDLGINSPWTVSALRIADLEAEEEPARLLALSEGDGQVLGPWSPSGRRLLIFRLRDHHWQPGVVELADRTVRWFDLASELPVWGQSALWRSDTEILMLVRPDGTLPQTLASAGRGRRALADRWAATAQGGPAQRSTLGSGAFAGDMPSPPENSAVRLDVVEGAVTRLASGRFIDLNLAPDRTLLALVETGSQTAFDPAAPFEPQAIDEARHLRLVALDSNTVTSPLGEADIAPDILSWSPVGNRLLVWRRGDRSWVDGGLVAVDGVTGAHERFDTAALEPYTGGGVAAFNTVYADWLEGRPILYARSGTSRYDWFRLTPSGPVNLTESLGVLTSTLGAISDDRLLLLADGRPWSVAADGAATPIPAPPGTFRDFDAPGIMEPRRERLNSPPRRGWMGVRQADGCIIRLAPGRAIPDAPPSEGFRAGVFAGPTAVMERTVVNGVQILTVRADGRSDRTLAVINERLRDVAFSRPDPVRQALPDGRTITSWLYRPPQRDGERLPLVVLSYPGGPSTPMAEPAGFNAWANPELVVGAGYAVLVPTLPLPFGEEPVSGYADRVLAVVDAALAQYPDLDGDRLAHWGHSFGGYIGLAVATQTDRFRSIIAVAGVSDLSAMWGEFSPVNRDNPEFGLSLRDRIGWAERSQGSMMAPPWVDPDRYVRNSPLFAADRIHVPVLLVHGDRDLVPLTQSQIMFSALWRQNKDARLLTYWGENHHFWSPGNVRDLYEQIIAWLGQTLASGGDGSLTPPPATPSVVSSSPSPTPR